MSQELHYTTCQSCDIRIPYFGENHPPACWVCGSTALLRDTDTDANDPSLHPVERVMGIATGDPTYRGDRVQTAETYQEGFEAGYSKAMDEIRDRLDRLEEEVFHKSVNTGVSLFSSIFPNRMEE